MSDVWTPEAYVKILMVDLAELNERFKAVKYALATGGDMRYATGEFLQYAGKINDNGKLLIQSINARNS